MTDKFDDFFGSLEGRNDGDRAENPRVHAIPLGKGAAGAAILAGLLGGLLDPRGPGAKDDGKHDDHPLLKRFGVTPPAPFRAATKEEFMAFFKGWTELKVGDMVKVREGYDLDTWPTKGEVAIVSQVLEQPIRKGAAYTEQMGRRNDVALIFVQNTDAEVMAAMAEAGDVGPQKLFEFLYDSRRLEKVGSVFE